MRSLLLLALLLLYACAAEGNIALGKQQHPTPPGKPLTMAQLKTATTSGVSVAEVSDYVYGGYTGALPSPPHADINPRKAYVIYWKDFKYRFVFSHEASYCPWFELPSGAAVSYQMFEGNEGWAELFNEQGRRERNSFVDVIERGEGGRVWVRWTYFGVNMTSGAAAYRAVEDFWAYPNGLILRRQRYQTLMPGDPRGYAREPIELIVLAPVGKLWYDVLAADAATGESRAFTGVDAFTPARVDIYWKRKDDPKKIFAGTSRRTGSPWKEIDDARGFAGIIPLRDGSPFFVIGDASGFPREGTRLKEHSDRKGTGGWGWGTLTWDHWPVGWLNSQAHDADAESFKRYPSHFAPFGLDLWSMPNETTEGRDFYSLIGVGGQNVEAIRALAKSWLGGNATDPQRAAAQRSLRDAPRR
ncbi:MAG TPA: hypothetical protein VGO96_14230 [Pyrinomonadaceae bacterium]|jgi:hypothetical protein|nr:hypothetical protein [Pyrinomonadaceae bacterium]